MDTTFNNIYDTLAQASFYQGKVLENVARSKLPSGENDGEDARAPALGGFSRASSVNPVSAVQDGPLSPTEAAIQAASYLGYLDMLYSKASQLPPVPGLDAEINRVIGLLKGLESQVKDSTILPMIQTALSKTDSAADYRNWWTTPTDPQGDTQASAILGWMGGTGFDPTSANPDTMFALLMFLTDSQSYSAGQVGLSSQIDAIFGQSNFYGNCSSDAAQFLCCYLEAMKSQGTTIPASLFSAIFPPDAKGTMPNYDAFVKTFATDSANWPVHDDPVDLLNYYYAPRFESFLNLFQ